MTRLAATALLLVTVAFPLAVYPAAPVTWLVLGGLLAGGAGVALLAPPVVTVGGTLVLIAYAVGLLITRPATDPAGAIALGVTLTLLLSVVHFAARVHGAAFGAAVVIAHLRQWVLAAGLGVIAAAALVAVGGVGAGAFRGATLPVVIAAAAIGAALTVAGVVMLVAPRK
jgi:hypothetical protein